MTKSKVALALLAAFAALAASASAATLPLGFTETLVTNGLTNPTAFEIAPDGRIFVSEQGGTLRVIDHSQLLDTPFLSLMVNSDGERGLLGIAFDPDFATNQFVYVYYTATTPTVHNRVSRFTASGNVKLAHSQVVILDLPSLSSATNHNGGGLHFGADGKLYVSVGENAHSANSQSLTTTLGKILRINSDGTIPADNPFVAQTSGQNKAIWAMGVRNPFTFAVDPKDGRLFIDDVGESSWEEINVGVAGSNYGWPSCEGNAGTCNGFTAPFFTYSHSEGCAITGGTFYDPPAPSFPAGYVGDYLFADLCSGWIRKIDTTNKKVKDFATGIANPVDLKVDAKGHLLYLERGTGSLWRVKYTPPAP